MIGWIERQGDRGKRILCLLMCFGGGIFLATYLLHMGPEVRQADTAFYVKYIFHLYSIVIVVVKQLNIYFAAYVIFVDFYTFCDIY